MTPSQYIAYFRQIATELKSIAFSTSNKSFTRGNINEFLDDLIDFSGDGPFMILLNKSGGFADSGNNPFDVPDYQFIILVRYDPNDFDGEEQAYDIAWGVGRDVLSRIYKDVIEFHDEGNDSLYQSSPLSSVRYSPVKGKGDNEVGFLFSGKMWSALDLTYDESKWTSTQDQVPETDQQSGRLSFDTSSPSDPIMDIPGVDDIDVNSKRQIRFDTEWLNLRNALLLPFTEAPDAGSLMAWSHVSAHVRLATTVNNLVHSGLLTVDGQVTEPGDRVFDHLNTDATLRGIWVAAPGAWTRSTDFDATADVMKGLHIKVLPASNNGTSQAGGATNGGKTFVVSVDDPIVVGTTPLLFTEYVTPYSDGYDMDNNEAIARDFDITTVNSGSYTGVINNSCRGWTFWDEAVAYMQLLKGSKMIIVANMVSPMIPYMHASRPLDFDDVDIDRLVAEVCYKISTCRKAAVEIGSIELGYENGVYQDVYLPGYESDYKHLCEKVIARLQDKYGDALPPLSGDIPSADKIAAVDVTWREENEGLDTEIMRQYLQFLPVTEEEGFEAYLARADELGPQLDAFEAQAISTGRKAGFDQFEFQAAGASNTYSLRQKAGEALAVMKLFINMINENLDRDNIIVRALMPTSNLTSGTHNDTHPLYDCFALGRNMFRNWGKISATITNVTGAEDLIKLPVSVENNFIHLELVSDFGRDHIHDQPEFFTECLGEILVLEEDYQTNGTDQLIKDQLTHADEFLNRRALADHLKNPNFFSARTTEVDAWIYVDMANIGGGTSDEAAVTEVTDWLRSVAATWSPAGGYNMTEAELNSVPNAIQKIAWQANKQAVEMYGVNKSSRNILIPAVDVNGDDVNVAVESYYCDDPLDPQMQHYSAASGPTVTIKKYSFFKLTISNIHF